MKKWFPYVVSVMIGLMTSFNLLFGLVHMLMGGRIEPIAAGIVVLFTFAVISGIVYLTIITKDDKEKRGHMWAISFLSPLVVISGIIIFNNLKPVITSMVESITTPKHPVITEIKEQMQKESYLPFIVDFNVSYRKSKNLQQPYLFLKHENEPVIASEFQVLIARLPYSKEGYHLHLYQFSNVMDVVIDSDRNVLSCESGKQERNEWDPVCQDLLRNENIP